MRKHVRRRHDAHVRAHTVCAEHSAFFDAMPGGQRARAVLDTDVADVDRLLALQERSIEDRRADVTARRANAGDRRVDVPARRVDRPARRAGNSGHAVHAIARCDACVDGSRDLSHRHVMICGRHGEGVRWVDPDCRRHAGVSGPDASKNLIVAGVFSTGVIGVRSLLNFHETGA